MRKSVSELIRKRRFELLEEIKIAEEYSERSKNLSLVK
jgi:hypothetical protein